ncbi:MAG: FtsQ-type POTRA domain-containing protein [Acutalibacter sp.]|nr:FtsQ-type POTRA domain-containing protein [Acutalibacter sp.]
MAKKQKNRKLQEQDFEDIRSYTKDTPDRRPYLIQDNTPPRPAEGQQRNRPAGANRPVRRPAPDWEIPEWELQSRRRPPADQRTSSRRPSERLTPPERLISPEHRPLPSGRGQQPRKRKSGVRKPVVFFLALIMTTATAILAIFLLFKISDIQVTGDVLEGHSDEEIIRIADCRIGGNLVFLSTGKSEKDLKTQIPYIQEVKLIRHLPNTLEIRVKAAQVAACVSGGSGWLCVNEDGKVLETRGSPQDGILQILGLTPPETEPGTVLQLEDSIAQTACTTILRTLQGLGLTGEFTRADLSDLSDIRLIYQNRIEFQLGSTLELDYKIELGCRALEKLGSNERGIMNLALSGDTKRAVFTAGEIDLAPVPPPVQTDDPAGAGTDGDNTDGDNSDPDDRTNPDDGDTGPDQDDDPGDGDDPTWNEPDNDSGDYRTEGIPDGVFTGN